MKTSSILGLNSRTQLFSYQHNKPRAKRVATSKLVTKRVLKKSNLPAPEIYTKFKRPEEIVKFDWSSLPNSFALKPSRGLGGEGIIVVKKRSKDGAGWITTSRRKVTVEDLKLHTLDILEGAYSLHNSPDTAFIEEFVGRHKAFRKYAYRGTPDIRVVVFNRVPVMAMLRLPTKDSGGRANLHQGAIGVGVDIATGITTKAIHYGAYIAYKPGTKRKLHGIKVPSWTKILKLAVETQMATGLGYLGVDIVLHPEKGPMVLEINNQPGLQIQLANMAGLKKRLERVEDLEVRDADHGVNIAKTLFAGRFADRVKAEEGIKTLRGIEEVKIFGKGGKTKVVKARVDTGAKRSSIDRILAEELGLLHEEHLLWKNKYLVRSATGQQVRSVVKLTFRLAGRKITTTASVANRQRLSTPFLVGRNDMDGFLVSANDLKEQ